MSSDPSVEGGLSLLFLIQVQEQARVNRVAAAMVVPTCVARILDVRSRDDVAEAARENVDRVVKDRWRQIELASER